MNVRKGLEGVVADETAISLVDGERGRLSYRGVDVNALTERSFGAVAQRVLGIDVPDFEARLRAAGQLTARERQLIDCVGGAHPMHVLQSAVLALETSACFDDIGVGAGAHGLTVAAKLPQIVAQRLRGAPAPYPAAQEYCARFLAQVAPAADAQAVDAFKTVQILQIEHGFNAGTFVARSVASTLAPVQNCIAAGLGALHGTLHGGADQAALEMAERLGCPQAAAAFVDDALRTGQRVMGMGHREYKTLDPRARRVRALAQTLSRGTPHEQIYLTLAAVEARFRERMAERGKALHANIEFYKGVIYRVLGLPPAFFTALFGMARVFGYVAHFLESRQDNRLIRPAARYVGPLPAPS